MKILVVNSGSSSVKFHLYEMPGEKLLMTCKAVKTGSEGTELNFAARTYKVSLTSNSFSFAEIFKILVDELVRPESECISSLDEVDVIGHRLIHGVEKGAGCEVIDKALIEYMESSVSLAPLHYPANLEGIRVVGQAMPGKFQAGVFDTAFHSTLPTKAFLYGISPDWYHKHRIRRYGFHGTSHKYVALMASRLVGLAIEKSRIISCHLGNGASVAAVKNGQSIDTSMGLTPVEGLIMGSRCGDIDAGVLTHLMDAHGFSATQIKRLINKEGGLLGLSGVSSDYRLVEKAAGNGNTRAQTALDVYHYRVKKYIGAYAAALEGVDVLVFTGGIGENSSNARAAICKGLNFLGLHLDIEKNINSDTRDAIISQKNSPSAIAVVTANEELEIARQVAKLAASVK